MMEQNCRKYRSTVDAPEAKPKDSFYFDTYKYYQKRIQNHFLHHSFFLEKRYSSFLLYGKI